MSFEVELLTPRVTATDSQNAGEKIKVENDEAYRMELNGIGIVTGKKKPSKPQSIIDQEKADAEAAKEAEAEAEEKLSDDSK
mgnify:CR=1 FL=1